jgi:hypothetical protein
MELCNGVPRWKAFVGCGVLIYSLGMALTSDRFLASRFGFMAAVVGFALGAMMEMRGPGG